MFQIESPNSQKRKYSRIHKKKFTINFLRGSFELVNSQIIYLFLPMKERPYSAKVATVRYELPPFEWTPKRIRPKSSCRQFRTQDSILKGSLFILTSGIVSRKRMVKYTLWISCFRSSPILMVCVDQSATIKNEKISTHLLIKKGKKRKQLISTVSILQTDEGFLVATRSADGIV